jgi:hypothetical protein
MFKAFRPPLTANSESNKVGEGLPGPIKGLTCGYENPS